MPTQNIWDFFTDPILRAPTLGCMLMCLAASLMGVIVFLRKQSLVGEALSHAAYPGLIASVIFIGSFWPQEISEPALIVVTLGGGFITALIGLQTIQLMEKYLRVPSDAALCFVLSTFFGIGLTLTSEVQFTHTALYKHVLTYLYGQAATMTDQYIFIYGALALGTISMIVLFYKELQIVIFDRAYAKSLGIRVSLIERILLIFVTLAVIIGIRSVGVVLMSAMLIAPAVAARQFTNRLSIMLGLAAVFGLISGFLGNYFSVQFTEILAQRFPQTRLVWPTGPMIVLVASFICLSALIMAPERGLGARVWRIIRFRRTCLWENLLKFMWRQGVEEPVSFNQLKINQSISVWYLYYLLYGMRYKGWIKQVENHQYQLTAKGKHKAERIVRLHRLWELYLVSDMGLNAARVHRSADEMEHILTPQLEHTLTKLLNNPTQDPHQQPIPPAEEFHAS